MRIFLIYTIAFFFVVILLVVVIKSRRPNPQIDGVHQEVVNKIPEGAVLHYPLVDEINEKNRAVRSFLCESVEVKTWERGMRFGLKGSMFYQKPLNFRFRVNSAFGDELDLGANEWIFWYWSRRDPQPGLYYAEYKDLPKTRLKTPFNPLFIRRSLGLDEINLAGATVRDTDSTLMLSYNEVDGVGQPVVFSMLLDKGSRAFQGCVITDGAGNILATSEVRERAGHFPKKLLFLWYEEDRLLSLEFSNTKTNYMIPLEYWQIPNRKPVINMADELAHFE